MNRADLMGWFPKGPSEDAGKGLRPVTDADLRSMAPELLAILLDAEAKNAVLIEWIDTEEATSVEHAEYLWEIMLAALTEGETP